MPEIEGVQTKHVMVETERGLKFEDFDLPDPFADAIAWLLVERRDYQPKKFDYQDDVDKLSEGVGQGSFWDRALTNYLHRAGLMGLDTPAGLQAIGKFAATAVALFEAACVAYGPPPPAGLPSGSFSHDDEAARDFAERMKARREASKAAKAT